MNVEPNTPSPYGAYALRGSTTGAIRRPDGRVWRLYYVDGSRGSLTGEAYRLHPISDGVTLDPIATLAWTGRGWEAWVNGERLPRDATDLNSAIDAIGGH